MSTITARAGLCLVLALAVPCNASAEADEASADDVSARRRFSRLVPAIEIVGFDLCVNRVADAAVGESGEYDVDLSSLRHNLTHRWVIDNDPFDTNQFLHPCQGAMYHGFARSAGLDYWKSTVYTFAGSAMWELAGETTSPSSNDQIATGFGGSILGEPLFRMASLVLERGRGRRAWLELAAAAIDPPLGFNRLAFGDRFDAVEPSGEPACSMRLHAGGSLTALTHRGLSKSFIRNEALLDFSMDYGLPGKPGYVHRRPFDAFSFQLTASSANVFESILSRGLLVGRDYEAGAAVRGAWGLYGTYDYIAPQIFRISSTGVGIGTTGQAWLSRTTALQGTALIGLGYGAAGTIRGSGERDYHQGATPAGLLALRLILGERASFDLAARDWYVSKIASHENGWENVVRAEASATLRIHGRHGVSLRYTYTRRHADQPEDGKQLQSRGTIGVFYTFLGGGRLGAVHWPRCEPALR